MPKRNAVIVLIASVLSLLCYRQASHNRYASTIAEAMGIIDAKFVKPVDHRQLFEGSMQGMTSTLDDYSEYVPPKRFQQLEENINQEFGGIGVEVDTDKVSGRLMVVTPLPDTPAAASGLRPGDLIMGINGKDTEGMNASDSLSLIRGQSGTKVTLSILSPESAEARDVVLERAIISTHSVAGDRRYPDGTWSFVLQDDPELAYVRLISFGENSAMDLANAIEEVTPKTKGMILDLRRNGGGLLEAAVEICDMFIEDGLIVSIRGRVESDERVYRATPALMMPMDFPLVILVDHFSASASEITAACLQDHQRATVVGERTWGKGTVQRLITMEGGRSALRLTTATYWRPSGKNIHRLAEFKPEDDWGVTPREEFTVDYTPEQRRAVAIARRDRDTAIYEDDKAETNVPAEASRDPAKDSEGRKDPSGDVAAPSENDQPSGENRAETAATEKASPENPVEEAAAASDSDQTDAQPVEDRQLQMAIERLRSLIDQAEQKEAAPEEAAPEEAAPEEGSGRSAA